MNSMSGRALFVVLLLFLRVSSAASTSRTYGVAVQASDQLHTSVTNTVASRQHRQLLEGFAGGTLSVESLKEKTGRFRHIKTKTEAEWTEQTAIIIVPSGEGRMLILESPPTSKFQVVLSATPRTHLSSGSPPPFLPDPISEWPTEDQCSGNGLLAAAFRQDRVPHNVSRLASPAIRFLRKRKADGTDKELLYLLAHNCTEPARATTNKTAEREEQRRQDRIANSTFILPEGTIGVLRMLNNTKQIRKDADRVNEGFKQIRGWPKPSRVAPALSGEDLKSDVALCKRQLQELSTTNINLPGLDGDNSRTECGNTTRSKIVVYVHNCFTEADTEMLVRVSLVITDKREDICQYNMLWTVQIMCVAAIFMMGLVACACILPEFVVAAYCQVCRMLEKRKRRQAKKARKAQAAAGTAPSSQDRHVKFMDEPPLPLFDDDGDMAGCYRMFHDTLSNLNNPSGYSRLYTVTVTTSAALLVAAIVWAPAIQPSAVHDNAFGDIIIIPRKGLDSMTGIYADGLLEDAWYYFKVMGLSALMGHTVKLALLSNLSPPTPGSKGVVVSPAVWWRQVVLSVLGLLLLGFVIGSYTMSFFVLRAALEILEAHWYLLAVMLANYGAAIGLYIHHTFRRRPPLTSQAAKQAETSCNVPPEPPSSLSLKAAASSLKQRVGWSRSLSDDASAASAPAAAARDTSAGLDQSVHSSVSEGDAASSRGEGGSEKEKKATLGQRICNLGSSIAAKIRGDIWEDDNFRYSSWVLTPVWLTILLVMFWWLTGVCRTGLVVDCLQDPATCAGGVIPFTSPVSELQMQVQDLLSTGKWAARVVNDTAAVVNEAVATIEAQLGSLQLPPKMWNETKRKLLNQINKFDTVLDTGVERAQEAAVTMVSLEQQAQKVLADAEHVGRWLGYSTAVLFALLSLYQIVKTFKRVLLFQVYMRKTAVEQNEMVDALVSRQSTGARMLARVMSTMRHSSSVNDTAELQENSNNEALSPFESKAANSPSTNSIRMRRGFSRSHTMIMPVPLPEHSPPVRKYTTVQLPGSHNSSPSGKEVSAHPLHGTESTASGRSYRRSASLHQQDGVALTSSIEKMKEGHENSLCVAIAQDIQRLEVDMARFGIGASTALFGVMASVMWIQIRIIGLVLTFVFTLICHPVVWRVTWESRLWIPVLTIIIILLFNMIVIKRFIGSSLLSDGTHIKHRGSWMTFFLMFQFTYMVMGTLYATWRVVLAIVSILLFAVAALDRSLMSFFTILDGPYIAFVASVKLEGAYLAISQRDVETEAEADRIRKIQEELEEEEEDEESEQEEGTEKTDERLRDDQQG